MRHSLFVCLASVLLSQSLSASSTSVAIDVETYRASIEKMKTLDRGPFSSLRRASR